MADSIVSCPGCGKRYSVPEGVPPGQFQCQDCSAVVPYGQPAAAAAAAPAAAPAGARAGKPSGGRKRRRGGRGRDEDEGDDDRGRKRGAAAGGAKKQDPMPYVLGIVAVGLVAIIGVILANRNADKGKGGTADTVASTSRGGGGLRAGEFGGEPVPEPAAAATPKGTPLLDPGGGSKPVREEPEDPMAVGPGARRKENTRSDEDLKYEAAANPPTGGNYGKSVDELRTLVRSDRASVVVPLEHLPDSGEDVRREVDSLVAVVANPDAGGEFIKAQVRLIEIGRPAVPRLLSAVAKLDFSKHESMVDARDPCVVADAVDSTLREITGMTKYTKLQYNPQGKLHVYVKVIENWYIWWLNTGYERARFSKPKDREEGGEEEL